METTKKKSKRIPGNGTQTKQTVSQRISRAGKFMRTLPQGEIYDMRAVLK